MLHPLFLDTGHVSLWPITATLVAAAATVYLLLPRPQPFPVLWGGIAGGLALLLAGVLLISCGPFGVENVLFYTFAGLAVSFGTLLVTQRDPARAALSFAMVVLSTCGLFLLQAAPFLMAATIIIYAGAIIVTFLFVLMLAQQHGLSGADYRSREALLSTVAGFVLLGSLLYVLKANYDTSALDPLLTRLHEAERDDKAKQQGPEAVKALLNDADYIAELKAAVARARPDLAQVAGEIDSLKTYHDVDMPEFDRVKRHLFQVRAPAGDLEPRVRVAPGRADAPKVLLSSFSGPPPNEYRSYDPSRGYDGASPLPAENVVGLGRSLFTDYLLSVELGGTLLLVATIGAIAITGRRGGRIL